MDQLQDTSGRRFQYLRLSVTEVCNFRCVYCLPNGYRKQVSAPAALSAGEIRNLVAGFSELGIWKVRLTGGEPTTRGDIVEIAREVASIPGIRRVAISTNGYRLTSLARPLWEAGVRAVNVSVDSLDPVRFARISGQNRLPEVLDGIQAAFEAGMESVKVNAVLMRGMNDQDLELFLEWAKKTPVSVRFIELMRTGDNRELFERHHLSAGEVQLRLARAGWRMLPRREGDGPALEYRHPDYVGRIGLIAPYSKDFCRSCNRLRVSSRGGLRLCLFGESDHDLRPLLQQASQKDELIAALGEMIYRKPAGHRLTEGVYGNTWNLAAIGG